MLWIDQARGPIAWLDEARGPSALARSGYGAKRSDYIRLGGQG